MTQVSEFATALGRSPDWWLLAARKAYTQYQCTHVGAAVEEPGERDRIRVEAASRLEARITHLLDLAEHSTSGDGGC